MIEEIVIQDKQKWYYTYIALLLSVVKIEPQKLRVRAEYGQNRIHVYFMSTYCKNTIILYLMKWTKSTLDWFGILDPFAEPDRSDIFTDDLNINALVAELTDDCNIFLATFLSLLTFDHFIFTLHSHSCFTCSSISCSLINRNSLKQNKKI